MTVINPFEQILSLNSIIFIIIIIINFIIMKMIKKK